MNKIIVVGSVFIIILFLFVPSIPAIQFKTVEGSVSNDFINHIKNIDLKNLEIVENLDEFPDHPILYYIVMIIYRFRIISAYYLFNNSIGFEYYGEIPQLYIKHPLLFVLAIVILFRGEMWGSFWESIANKMGWNW